MGNAAELQRIWDRDAERYGILSMSKSKCNPHLWKEYGEAGSGLCIEYNFNRIIDDRMVDWICMPVEYVEKIPPLNILDFWPHGSAHEFVRHSFRMKTRQWMVEEEVRIVYPVEDLIPPKVSVPPETIRAVYLGPNISEQDRQTIRIMRTQVPILDTRIDEAGTIVGFREL